MQTFLPYADFRASAAVLDDRRLGKQRVEVYQVLRALTWPTYGWKNHPAVRMWRGFTTALVSYGVTVCEAWSARGHADAVGAQLLRFSSGQAPEWADLRDEGRLPPWLGHDVVHRSHQSALVRKDPEHYRRFFPDVPDDLPYVWPSPAFPRWPVRRPGAEPLTLPEALTLLGYAEPRPGQAEAVEAAVAGRSAQVRFAPGGGATGAGLLAGLCTPGGTLWVTPGPLLPATPVPPVPPVTTPVRTGAGAGKVSTPIAREPGEAELVAMAAEAAAPAEFRYLRPRQVDRAAATGAGLVVLDDGARLVADVGLPVLTLITV